MKIAFLASGLLGERVLKSFIGKFKISFILTDEKSENIIELCNDYNIPLYVGNPRKSKIDVFLGEQSTDVIISVSYLYIVDEKVLKTAEKFCFNIHGSLLPKYRGRTPHVWAIINNEKETGVTAHIMDLGCDTGDIIKQIKIKIQKHDTGYSILKKFEAIYIPLIKEVLDDFEKGSLKTTKQNETKATFFGKRTPEDGLIDWNWSVERIINWVRAQSNPYPGAFTYYQNRKLIIDQVSKSEIGFHYKIENGTIISSKPLRVKCCNGVICINRIRELNCEFEVNNKFENG